VRAGLCLALVSLALGGCASGGEAPRRVALVVGNSAYLHAPPLRNPANDARAVSAALTRLGWQVSEGLDQTRAQLEATRQAFAERAKGADAAVFFYAGHALQFAGQNYLVPVDADLETEDLGPQLCELNAFMRALGLARTSIVFLDACRTNPWADALTRQIASGRTVHVQPGRGLKIVPRGLAKVSSKAGTLIAFATSPGMTAADGDGAHSPFSGGLLEHLETPGLEVTELLRRVRASVQTETGGQQLPWDSSALVDPFYFRTKSVSRPPPP
jgi:uncharacterized caspase-like protein